MEVLQNEIRTLVIARLGIRDPKALEAGILRDELDRHIISLAGQALTKVETIVFFWAFTCFNYEEIQEIGVQLYGREWQKQTVRQKVQDAFAAVANAVNDEKNSKEARKIWTWAKSAEKSYDSEAAYRAKSSR